MIDIPMIAVRPPEYFPNLAYMALVQAADVFVLADTFQYSRQSFQNRARLRTPQGWQWISIPLKGGQQGAPIDRVRIEGREPWGRKHWRSFQYNYSATPFFPYYADDFHGLLMQHWTGLGALTGATVALLHPLLNLKSRLIRSSSLPSAPASLPGVLSVLDGESVLLPEEILDHDRLHADAPSAFHYEHPVYRQHFEGFVPGMSTVDLLFNHGPEASEILRRGSSIRRCSH